MAQIISKIKKIRKKNGFTLVEILVSLLIFAIISTAILSIFISSLKSQRRILAEQQLLDQTSYFLEYFSRAARTAQKDVSGGCTIANGNYATSGSGIIYFTFLDNNSRCHRFYLESGTVKEQISKDSSKDNFTTPPTAPALPLFSSGYTVNAFRITGAGWSPELTDKLQPSVTIYLEISGKENVNIKTQTTVSQRDADIAY